MTAIAFASLGLALIMCWWVLALGRAKDALTTRLTHLETLNTQAVNLLIRARLERDAYQELAREASEKQIFWRFNTPRPRRMKGGAS